MPLDFTLTKSAPSAVAQCYPTLTLSEYFQGKDLPVRFAMMSHDRKPENALFTARVEAESGIRATYYFRRYGSAYRPRIMKERKGRGGTRPVSVRGAGEGGTNVTQELSSFYRMIQKLLILRKKIIIEKDRL